MYLFRLWFEAERWKIARAELEPHRQRELAKYPEEWKKRVVNKHFDAAIPVLVDKLHPFRIFRK